MFLSVLEKNFNAKISKKAKTVQVFIVKIQNCLKSFALYVNFC